MKHFKLNDRVFIAVKPRSMIHAVAAGIYLGTKKFCGVDEHIVGVRTKKNDRVVVTVRDNEIAAFNFTHNTLSAKKILFHMEEAGRFEKGVPVYIRVRLGLGQMATVQRGFYQGYDRAFGHILEGGGSGKPQDIFPVFKKASVDFPTLMKTLTVKNNR